MPNTVQTPPITRTKRKNILTAPEKNAKPPCARKSHCTLLRSYCTWRSWAQPHPKCCSANEFPGVAQNEFPRLCLVKEFPSSVFGSTVRPWQLLGHSRVDKPTTEATQIPSCPVNSKTHALRQARQLSSSKICGTYNNAETEKLSHTHTVSKMMRVVRAMRKCLLGLRQ
jgi:hypothetical protein